MTTAGKNIIARLVAKEDPGAAYVALGFGTALPSENDTGLGFEVGRAQATTRVVGNRTIYTASITVSQSGILSEIGLIIGTTLVCRRVAQGRWVASGTLVVGEVSLEFVSA